MAAGHSSAPSQGRGRITSAPDLASLSSLGRCRGSCDLDYWGLRDARLPGQFEVVSAFHRGLQVVLVLMSYS